MANLDRLPAELIAHIVSFLSNDQDVLQSRLISKCIERSSISYFGRRFFQKKGFMITEASLQVLQSVSEHRDLCNHVQHLWFNPDCFTFNQSFNSKCACSVDPQTGAFHMISSNFDNDPRHEAFLQCTADHRRTIEVSRLTRILTGTLFRLPNLKVIGMRRSEDHAPWGWRQLRDAVGQDPRIIGPIYDRSFIADELSGPTKLFLALVNAISATGLRLLRLYTDAVEIDNVRPDILTDTKLAKVFNSIWYLEINCTRTRFDQSQDSHYRNLEDSSVYGDGLARLLKACTNLKELGLQIFPDMKQSHMVPPHGQWRQWSESYQYQCLSNLIPHVHFPYLTRLKLEKFASSPTALLAFLSPTLTSIKLRGIRLIVSQIPEPQDLPSNGDDHGIATTDTSSRPWQTVFSHLHISCPNLAYLLLNHLMHAQGGVSFIPNPPAGPSGYIWPPPQDTNATTPGHFAAPDTGSGDASGEEGLVDDEWTDDLELFTNFEHIALEVKGTEQVRERLKSLVEGHWYREPIFSYAMDDELWHTDTSDEE